MPIPRDHLELVQGKPLASYVVPPDTAHSENVRSAQACTERSECGETTEAEPFNVSEPRVANGVQAAAGDATKAVGEG